MHSPIAQLSVAQQWKKASRKCQCVQQEDPYVQLMSRLGRALCWVSLGVRAEPGEEAAVLKGQIGARSRQEEVKYGWERRQRSPIERDDGWRKHREAGTGHTAWQGHPVPADNGAHRMNTQRGTVREGAEISQTKPPASKKNDFLTIPFY